MGRRRIRRNARRAELLNCPKVVGQKFGNSCCFQCDHRYSTGFSSGAYAGKIFQPQTPSLLVYVLPHLAAAMPG